MWLWRLLSLWYRNNSEDSPHLTSVSKFRCSKALVAKWTWSDLECSVIHPNVILCSFTWIYFYPSSRRPKSVSLCVLAPFWPFSVCRNHHSWEVAASLSQVLCLRRVECWTSRVTTHRLRYFCKAVYQGLKAYSQKVWRIFHTVKICSVCGTRFGQLHTATNSVRLKSLPASPEIFSHIPGERRRPRLSLGFSERRSKSWMQTNVNLDRIWLWNPSGNTEKGRKQRKILTGGDTHTH